MGLSKEQELAVWKRDTIKYLEDLYEILREGHDNSHAHDVHAVLKIIKKDTWRDHE